MEMNDEITIVRHDRGVKSNASDATPILERPPFVDRQAVCLAFIGHLDVERERPLWHWIPMVVDLRHDFITKIRTFAFNFRLRCRNQEAHEGRRLGRLVIRLSELGNLIQLADTGFLVDPIEHHPRDDQDCHPGRCAAKRSC